MNIGADIGGQVMSPTLLIQTTYFAHGDRRAAVSLGRRLYGLLTRRHDDELAIGPGIPVRVAVDPGRVRCDDARFVVLVVVLGDAAFQSERTRAEALDHVARWHQALGSGRVLLVPTSSVWRAVEPALPSNTVLAYFQAREPERDAVEEILLAIGRVLDDRTGDLGIQLFVSHAKVDRSPTQSAAALIHRHVVTRTTGRAFFDLTDLRPGHEIGAQIDAAAGRGVLIVLRSDHYSSRTWCQRELLTAKRHGLPTLTVEVLDAGEERTLPYAGNGPAIVWRGDPAKVATRAMVEWIRARHFALEGERIIRLAGLPSDTRCIARPPELLDFAQGPLERGGPTLVLHPDPELSVHERAVLQRAQPRLRLVTPTSLFRRVLASRRAPMVDAPLAGRQIALSLSDSPDSDGPDGLMAEHLRDATIHLARTLVAAGGAIAYGGDFRQSGFSLLLSELVAAYNQVAETPGELLHSYLAAHVPRPENVAVTVHSLADPDGLRSYAVMALPANGSSQPRSALYHSEMRRAMAHECFARVLMGAQARPGTGGRAGYRGRFPGVVEEAWRTLEVGAPLYVAGGFGGGAAVVARLLEGESSSLLDDRTFEADAEFMKHAEAIDADPDRVALGLPSCMTELAELVQTLGQRHLLSDAAALAWNGLDVNDNRVLFRACDPFTITSLVMKGLLRLIEHGSAGRVRIELVRGDITSVSDVDAVAVAVFRDVEAHGAGAALDRVLAGRLSTARAAGHQLVCIPGGALDADWLYLADLGRLGERRLDQAISEAAEATVTTAARCGFRRIAVVAFGANVEGDVATVVPAMVRGFASTRSPITLVWFEIDPRRFEAFRVALERRDDVELSVRRQEVLRSPTPPADAPTQVSVRWAAGRLTTTILPPTGSAALLSVGSEMSDEKIREFTLGRGRQTPPVAELECRGAELASSVLGPAGLAALTALGDSRVVLLHDLATAGLPFETMVVGERRLAIDNCMVRRPELEGLAPERLFTRPLSSRRLRVLLVADPLENLVSAQAEAKVLRDILATIDAVELLEDLDGAKATKAAVIDVLTRPDIDVLHYAGHAFFEGPGPDRSGLELADGRLTLGDLKGAVVQPRLAFMNACELGRVRGVVDAQTEVAPLAVAELFLRSGIEAYLGTFWQVDDAAAARFAATVYTSLADGMRLRDAVASGRRALEVRRDKDWANYILYGDGALKMRQDEERERSKATDSTIG